MSATGPIRTLVVNADDLGASAGVNRGIAEAHTHGIVTSASLMVRGAAATEAAALGREHPALSIGLHIDLGEWSFEDGDWRLVDRVVDADDAVAVRAEVERQLRAFRHLTRMDPTHLDSHQHAHLSPPAAAIVDAAGARLGVPVRRRGAIVYRGEFYGQTSRGEPRHEAVAVDALVALLATIGPGVSELCCHPGYAASLRSAYVQERELELRALCDARVAGAIVSEGIALRSFLNLRATGGPGAIALGGERD